MTTRSAQTPAKPAAKPPARPRRQTVAPTRRVEWSGGGSHAMLTPRAALLTREEETQCAQDIEQGELAVLEAVAASSCALRQLALLGVQLEQGEATPADVVRITTGDDKEAVRAAARIAKAAAGLEKQVSGQQPEESPAVSKLPGAGLKEAVLPHRLGHVAVNRILAALEADAGHAAAAAAIRSGRQLSEAAMTRLVEANMRLVYWVAQRRLNRGIPLHDLIQEGSLGLMHAADRFDHRHGVKFGTYAAWWVRHFVNRALSDHSRTIRLPARLCESKAKMTRVTQAFQREQGRDPTEEELVEQTGLPAAQIRHLLTLPAQPVSLDAPRGAEGDWSLVETVRDDSYRSPVEIIAARQTHAGVRRLMDVLTPREQEVIRLRFGVDQTAEGMTFERIGRRFSLSRERVRQIESIALEKLRKEAELVGTDLVSDVDDTGALVSSPFSGDGGFGTDSALENGS